jgi:hypothetical protein
LEGGCWGLEAHQRMGEQVPPPGQKIHRSEQVTKSKDNVSIMCVSTTLCNMKQNILTAVHRRLGEYWSSLETRSTASGGILL